MTKQFLDIVILTSRFSSQMPALKTVPSDQKSNRCTCAEECQMPFKGLMTRNTSNRLMIVENNHQLKGFIGQFQKISTPTSPTEGIGNPGGRGEGGGGRGSRAKKC